MPLLIITLTLLCFGLVMLYSASYVKGIYEKGDSLHYISSQLKYAVLGLVVMAVASKIDYRIFRRYSYFVLILTYILLVVVLFMPEINYAKRWIFLPSPTHPIITFQPSEIAKFSVILLFADLIQKKGDRMKTLTHGVIPFVAILGSIALLMLMEPHISGTLIIMVIGVIMMFVGGTDLKWFFLGIALVVAAGVMAVIIEPSLVARAMGRIDAWLNPESDLQGGGYQSYMSLLAIGSGGLFGLGLGNSRQKHLHLPEPQNDFIFAVICEELGFFGGMMVIALFFALLVRGIYVAARAKDKFGAMIVIGVISQISIQAFLNIAVATNTIPNTGISLPFFSEGGTSLTMLLAEMGIVLSVSRYAHLEKGE
ncbi:MAG: cell division protein FtsW [Oscillospiraceae bacterium]|nr:cell division protein FtsW [Oscillospiraceae bacterium]